MSAVDLDTLLEVVGPLDDSTDPNSARTRFRNYLKKDVHSVSDLRDYVENALSTSGDQYNKALQDLINHIGTLLGFEVAFGRYRGVRGEIGFDGLWRSDTGQVLVVEVKTTGVYTSPTSTVLGYVNDLVSDGRIERPEQAIGLYVYGLFDSGASQLEKAIIGEGQQGRLRVVSVNALLNLFELQQEYELEHETVLQLLLPPPVRADAVVNLIFSVTAQERREAVEEVFSLKETQQAEDEFSPTKTQQSEEESHCNYYLFPAADSEDGTPVVENLHRWLDQGMWGLGQRTGYRKAVRPGDRVCFYASAIGVVAEATAASAFLELAKEDSPTPHLRVPYGIRLKNVRWFEDKPVPITQEVRSELSAFEGRDLSKGWSWFVMGTSKLTRDDFRLLTGRTTIE